MERSILAYQGVAYCGLAIRIPPIPTRVLTPMLIVSHLLVAVPARLLPLLVVGMEQEDQQQRQSFSDRLPFLASRLPQGVRVMDVLLPEAVGTPAPS
jgi:hypothetical protein